MSGPSENPIKRIIGEIHRRSLWQVLAIYVVSGWVVYEAVQSLTEGLGLPGWFPALAFILLLIGLPIVLATAFVQEGGPARSSREELADLDEILSGGEPSGPSPPAGIRRLLTWRNALVAGVLAFALWGVVAAGWVAFGSATRGADPRGSLAEEERPSVAVLPFDDLSPEGGQEYFSHGITEEILHTLSQLEHLRVPGRTSSFAFTEANLTIAQIADTLDVTHVVEGSVRKAGDRVRITAQLIDARNDTHVWSQTYERSLEDVFAIQGEIAQSITDALEVRLAGRDRAQMAMRGTILSEAHDEYLRGRYFWNQRTPESLTRAAERFRRAIELDSTYAEAWSGLADTYAVLPWYPPDPQEPELNLSSLRSRALEAARRAVELAPDNSMTRTSLAEARFFNGHWQEAEREFERAIGLNPNHAAAQAWYGEFLAFTGRAEEGIAHLERAVEIDPVSKISNWDLMNALTLAGRFEAALAQVRKTIELDPNWPPSLMRLGTVLSQLGRHNEALEARVAAFEKAGVDSSGVRRIREFFPCAQRFYETGERQGCPVPPGQRGQVRYDILLQTGQKDEALQELERIVESGTFDHRWLAQEHTRVATSHLHVDPRDDPRYQELMEQMGIDW